jgi:MoaA/NifB/PqqE/SkfB family radical SAM enzyme
MCVQNRHNPVDKSRLQWYDPELEMPLEIWTSVLDQVLSFRPWISVTGGEPLLYPGFQEFVTEAKKRKLPVDITTNGLLLADHARFIVESGVEIVYVSVDGPEDVHEEIRGLTGAFRRTAAGLRALVEARQANDNAGPLIAMNCTISRANLHVLDQMVPIAVEAGVDLLQFIHAWFDTKENAELHNSIMCAEWAHKNSIDLIEPSMPLGEFYENEIGEAELPTLREALHTARKQAENVMNIKMLPDLGDDALGPYYLDINYPFAKDCKALWTFCKILPDGTVSPCHHVIAGNVKNTPLLDIWNGRTMSRYREIVARQLFPACARCCRRGFKIATAGSEKKATAMSSG